MRYEPSSSSPSPLERRQDTKSIFGKVLWVERAAVFAVGLALMLGVLLITANPVDAKTFTVNYTGDAEDSSTGDHVCDVEGFVFACSLRAAIQQADITDGPDTINFNIHPTHSGCDDSGVCTIAPDDPIEPLPRIDAPLTINGYSQPGAKPNTRAPSTTPF